MVTQAVIQKATENLFNAYSNILTDPDDITDTLNSFLALLTDNVAITYSGKSGATPFFGQFFNKPGASSVIRNLADSTNNARLDAKEFVTTSYKVDFTQANPLTLQNNRSAIVFEQEQTAIESGLSYRLNTVAFLTVENDGLISSIQFNYDSYIPSQAFADQTDLIANPDIYSVIDPKRDFNADPQETLTAVLNFFGTFAGITDNNFTKLLPVIQRDMAIKFTGDPRYIPFADNQIRVGSDQVVQTFTQLLANTVPRSFDINEFFVENDMVVTNTYEARTAVQTNRGYELPLGILLTARKEAGDTVSKVASLESIFDSAIATTAFTNNDPFPISTTPKPPVRMQGNSEFINLTGYDSNVSIGLDVYSEAAFNNSIGIYKVDDITGRIGTLKPGDAGYLQQVITNTVLSFDRGTAVDPTKPFITQSNLSQTLAPGTILAAYIVTNGTAQELLAKNPTNAQGAANLNAFFTFVGANPDNFDHFKLANNSFLVEDFWGGGDQDFNDMRFGVTVTPIA